MFPPVCLLNVQTTRQSLLLASGTLVLSGGHYVCTHAADRLSPQCSDYVPVAASRKWYFSIIRKVTMFVHMQPPLCLLNVQTTLQSLLLASGTLVLFGGHYVCTHAAAPLSLQCSDYAPVAASRQWYFSIIRRPLCLYTCSRPSVSSMFRLRASRCFSAVVL
ncbi:hypothetical protein J6590_094544 [Homalodisca vitripennis]|nr:hypothetical protein J6590_094544 [Homalodisca vitripennis]